MNIQKATENGPIEIVDIPIKHGDFPLLCKRSPEGTYVHEGFFFGGWLRNPNHQWIGGDNPIIYIWV